MILLDTDHIVVLRYRDHPAFASLVDRLSNSGAEIATTVITLEEQMRGWLAEIKRRKVVHQVPVYARLAQIVDFYSQWKVMPFDEAAADRFTELAGGRVRIGTQDLKIASIALTNQALLLSSNLRHFQQVPGLQVEDWVH